MKSSYPHSTYQVGGSLSVNAPTYVRRQADDLLFQGLLQGEFCYVFNARQMGKSSLRVQTTHRLQNKGIRCGVIDMTAIGTQEITPEQWYASIAGFLTKKFQLNVNLLNWWRDRSHLSLVNRLEDFLDTVLLAQTSEPIVIFVDEIDSVLSLRFSTDDFFALIRACYNRRAEQPEYQRLTFTLLGVAVPGDLIADPIRTPFNIGRAIELRGFQADEAAPLLAGLTDAVTDPPATLQRILDWTGGQPFLTQKLCQLVVREAGNSTHQNPSQVDQLVQTCILEHWEAQDEPQHLKTIRDRLLYNEQTSGRLLGLYQQILLSSLPEAELPVGIPANDSAEQTELLLTGLVEKRDGILQVKNPIYQQVFNWDWLTKQLRSLRPYSQAINAWIASDYRDESWLLRGQALRDMLAWAQGKRLSDTDYRFLAASQELDRQEEQQRLEAERLKEVETRLELERSRSKEQQLNLKRQRILLGIVSLMMMGAIALGLIAYYQYQQTAVGELRAIVLSSDALFASNKWFDALLQAVKAKQRSHSLHNLDADLKAKIELGLQRAVLNVQEYNRLDAHQAAVLAVDFSPDGQQIATAGVDANIHLWHPDGTLIKTLQGHTPPIRSVRYSPTGDLIASAGDDKTIRLWSREGTAVKTLSSEIAGIWSIAFSPDGTKFVAVGSAREIELWGSEGRLIWRIQGQAGGIRDAAFSPDGSAIATANADNTVTVWNLDGSLRNRLEGHTAPVQAIAFSPNGDLLASGSSDKSIKLWNRQGELLNTLYGHDSVISGLAFSPNGQQLISASWDKTLKLWARDGTLISTLYGHDAGVWRVAFSPQGEAIASAGADNHIILWKSQSPFSKTVHGFMGTAGKLVYSSTGEAIALAETDKTVKLRHSDGSFLRTIPAHNAAVIDVDFNPAGNLIVTSSEDKTTKIWTLDGTLVRTFRGYSGAVLSVGWSPDNQRIAASDVLGNLWLWQPDGTLVKTIKAHDSSIWNVEFSPNGQKIATASNDGTIRLWSPQGKLLNTLKGHTSVVWKVAFSPDGEQLASGSGDLTAKLWRQDGTLLKTLKGHTAAIWGIAFSPDGSVLATASIDETIKLWTRDGDLIITLKGHRAGVRSIAFHPHQPTLASVSDDQTMIFWDVQKILNLHPLEYACRWMSDYLRTNPLLNEDDRSLCQKTIVP